MKVSATLAILEFRQKCRLYFKNICVRLVLPCQVDPPAFKTSAVKSEIYVEVILPSTDSLPRMPGTRIWVGLIARSLVRVRG
jgi:hypothetical protein